MLGLFLLCAVVPTVVLAAASYWMVTRELERQAEAQLRQVAKISGVLLLARLHEAERRLADLAVHPPGVTGWGGRSRMWSEASFDSVGVHTPGARSPSAPLPLARPLAKAELGHLRRDRTLLIPDHRARNTRLLLMRAVQPTAPNTPIVWGELASDYLWGERTGEPLTPANVEFCAYAKGVEVPLHCSSGNGWRGAHSGPESDGAVMRGSSDVFLSFEFGTPAWTMQVAQPVGAFTAPIEFRRSVLLTLALGLWMVVLASNVLLRHRLDPVARLQEATQRVAAGDFAATVEVCTRDELEDLAGSFNLMARRLREQFALLGALHHLDREALTGKSDEEIAKSALLHLPQVVPTTDPTIAIRLLKEQPGGTTVWRRAADGTIERRDHGVPASHDAELCEQPGHWVVEPGGSPPAIANALGLSQQLSHLVLPIAERGRCFGVLILSSRPGTVAEFSEPAVTRARQVADQLALALANSRLVQRLSAMTWGTLQTLARSIDAVSPWTAGHSERVTRIGIAIGKQLRLTADQIDQLHRGGLLHDVGKIGVPASILDKPGTLDKAEFQAIRGHPVIGARILEPIHAYEDVIPIVRHHHERFDGTGYPDGLAGRAIPYLARVLSVADVYDALVSDRPYREGWAHEAAVDYITTRAGIEFDPDVVTSFLELVRSPEWPLHLGGKTASTDLPIALAS